MKDKGLIKVRAGMTDRQSLTGVNTIMRRIVPAQPQRAMNHLTATGLTVRLTMHLHHGSEIPAARTGRILKTDRVF